MSKQAIEISQVHVKADWKELTEFMNMVEILLRLRQHSPLNVTFVKFRFGSVVVRKNLLL